MSSSGSPPPPLPISDPQAHPDSPAVIAPFLTRLSDYLRRMSSRCRPWLELVDRSAVSHPTSLADATSRIRKNVAYFLVNYLIVLATVVAFSLLSQPLSLLTLGCLLGAWLFLYLLRPADQPLVVLRRTFTNGETLRILVAVTAFVIFLTSIASLLMSTTLIGVGIVCIHGAFRDPEDLLLDDQDLSGYGFFSMISGAASSAAVSAAAPGIASHV